MFKKMMCVLMIFGLGFSVQAEEKAKKAGQKKEKAAAPAPLKLEVIKLNGSEGKDIVEVAQSSADHSTLVTAVVAAGLVPTLTGPGPYTIFAPTNAAFKKLPEGTVATLLKPENQAKLKSVLEHHAAAPAFNPDILSTQEELDKVDGPKLKVTQKDGKLFVDGVEIKAAIAAKNGIVYVVDTVLLGK